ncbi:MAG: hypothetical protein P1S60_08295 [Anaerolineae bacterium]|nr:hypothetical protein [Anaerolineae bacterium]
MQPHISVILGHLHQGSFNHAIAHCVVETLASVGHHVCFHDPLQALWKNCAFDLCGVEVFFRKMYSEIVTITLEQRLEWVEDVVRSIH